MLERRASPRRAPPTPSAIRNGGWCPRRAGSRSDLQSPRLAVDVHCAVTHESAECDAAISTELDGETRRRADRDEKRAARDRRLLDELERDSAADAQNALGQRQETGAVRPADHLVERVVTADGLTHPP